jgi:hypothetical protein
MAVEVQESHTSSASYWSRGAWLILARSLSAFVRCKRVCSSRRNGFGGAGACAIALRQHQVTCVLGMEHKHRAAIDVHDDDVPVGHGGEWYLVAASGPLRGDDDGLRDLAAEEAYGGVSARVRVVPAVDGWPGTRNVTALDAAILRRVKADDNLARRYAILTSIAGIGFVAAATLLACLPELGKSMPRSAASSISPPSLPHASTLI